MHIICYDTETTGLVDFKQPSEGPQQPHLVELAASLFDDTTGDYIDGFSVLVKPDDWVISEEVSKIHGITHEMAMAEGIPEHQAVAKFLALNARASLRVAHNEAFDQRILRIAMKRYGNGAEGWQNLTQEQKDVIADDFKAQPAYCTCNASKQICQIPATDKMKKTGFGRTFKSPNLGEAFEHFTGQKLEGAHRAHVDVAACAKVYFALNPIQAVA